MIKICSFCEFFGEVQHPYNACPSCGYPTLRKATEWEMFMGRRLGADDELEVRERVAAMLKKERH